MQHLLTWTLTWILDTSQTYILFQTLLLLFWPHSCMIWTKLTRTDAFFSRATSVVFFYAGFWIFRYAGKIPKIYIKISVPEASAGPKGPHRAARVQPGGFLARPSSWPRYLPSWVGPTPLGALHGPLFILPSRKRRKGSCFSHLRRGVAATLCSSSES